MKKDMTPAQVVHLTRLSAELFGQASKETLWPVRTKEKAEEMHFVADMFKRLVDTCCPEDCTNNHTTPCKEHIGSASLFQDKGKAQGIESHLISIEGEQSLDDIKKIIKDIFKGKGGTF